MEPDIRRASEEGAEADGRAEGGGTSDDRGGGVNVGVGGRTADAGDDDGPSPRQRVAPPESPGGAGVGDDGGRKVSPPPRRNGNDKVSNGARATAPGVSAVPPRGGVGPDPAAAKGGGAAASPEGAIGAESRRKQRVVVPQSPGTEAPVEDAVGRGARPNQAASSEAKPRPAARAAAPGAVAVPGPAPVGKVARSSAAAPRGEGGGSGNGNGRRVQRIVGASSGPSDLSLGDDPIAAKTTSATGGSSGTGKPAAGPRATSPGVTSVSGLGAVKGGGGDPSASYARVQGMDEQERKEPANLTEKKVSATPSTYDVNPKEMDNTAAGVHSGGVEDGMAAISAGSAASTSSAKPRVGERAASPGVTAISGVDGTGGPQNKNETRERRVQRIAAPSRPSDAVAVGTAMLATSAAKPQVVERATAPGAVAVATHQANSRTAAKVAEVGNSQRPRVHKVLSGRILPDATVDLEVDNRGKIPAPPSPPSTTAPVTGGGPDAKPRVQSRATAAGAVAVAGIGSAGGGAGGGGDPDAKPRVQSRATAAGAIAVPGIGAAGAVAVAGIGSAAHGDPSAAAAATSRPWSDDVRVQRTAELRCPSDTAIAVHDGEADGDGTAAKGDAAGDAKAKVRAQTKVRADAPGASSVVPSDVVDGDVNAKSQTRGDDDDDDESASEEMERKRQQKIIAAARTLLNAGGANDPTIHETEAPSHDVVLEKEVVAGSGADASASASASADQREQVVQSSAPSFAGGGGDFDRVSGAGFGAEAPVPPPGMDGGSNPAPVSCELLVETSLQRGETIPPDMVAATFTAPVGQKMGGGDNGYDMGGDDNGYDTVDTGVEAAASLYAGYKVPQESTCRGRHPFLCGRRMLCLYAFVVVAVAIIVPSVLLPGNSVTEGEDGPSQTSAERVASFSNILDPISGPAVRDSGTPQNRAMNWLATEDPARLPSTGDVDRIVQRYVLACLYYSTKGEGWGDRLYFLSGDNECRWNEWNKEAGFLNGVTCYKGRVDYLMLPNNGLVGTIPFELQELSSMTRLALNANLLSSTVPSQLFNLTSLEHLGLQFNQLVGTISTKIGSLLDLTELNLAANTFNDTIPDSLGNLAKLKLLVLHSNRFTGAVPDSFNNLESLETLHLYGNSVTGNVSYMCDMGVTEITADCFEVACSCPSCDCY